MFAEVAVPVHVRKTFTYNLPGDLSERARIGCRVIVPFGRKLLTGFIVAFPNELPAGTSEAQIRDVEELVDEVPIVADEILELTRWMSDYYHASWGECIRAALPGGAAIETDRLASVTEGGRTELNRPAPSRGSTKKREVLEVLARTGPMTVRELEQRVGGSNPGAIVRQLERDGMVIISHQSAGSRLRPKLQNVVRIREGIEDGLKSEVAQAVGMPGGDSERVQGPESEAASPKSDAGAAKSRARKARGGRPGAESGSGLAPRVTPAQERVLERLKEAGGTVPLSELLEMADVSSSVIRTLEKRGIVETFAREVRRDPLAHVSLEQADNVTLNEDQRQVLEQILPRIGAGTYATFLLHGVTGSGKTEIYVRAMLEATRQGKSALMLVPEIALTPVFARRLRAAFGETLAIIHSSLSEGERADEWRRIRAGSARVVIGTRSAVFAPLANLGIIVVDEEHETSYKQDETPRYHGRDTAIVRASKCGAVVILGSATPSLESYHNAQSGKYQYLRLTSRFGNRPLAAVEIVDMRATFQRHGKQQVFSDELMAALGETFARGEQSIVLLNRRGYSSFCLCRSCGEAVHCPNCDVTLTFHRFNTSLVCHYCNHTRPAPRACPACGGQYVQYVGQGTEQIEAKLTRSFPAQTIARVDRDTMRRRGQLEHTLMRFGAGEIDLLVGTQLLAKGHDFPNVTLVGVISVDVGLSLPDFRSAERTFQLLTQVAGRAGRGDRPGRVLIQTYHPEHYALGCAQTQDYDEFYRREIAFRRAMHYPPFTALINVLVHDKNVEQASGTAGDLARELRAAADPGVLRILGPAPAPLSRLKGEYRFQLLIKARNRRSAREALDAAVEQIAAAGRNRRAVAIEVDPINLM